MRFFYPVGNSTTVHVFDEADRMIASLADRVGIGEIAWDISAVPTGLYTYVVVRERIGASPAGVLVVVR